MIKKNSAFFWYTILALGYLLLSLLVPVNAHSLQQFHLTIPQYRTVIFIVLLPYILIWLTAFYSYLKMYEYTDQLGDAAEKPAFQNIAKGVQVLAWGLAVPAIISTLLKAIATKHPGFEEAATIISNYLTLSVPLIAFTLIGNGSRKLSDLVKTRPTRVGIRIFAALFITFGVYYCVLTLQARHAHGNPYHLSFYLTLFTIIVPYLYAWFLGFMNCYEIILYAKKTKGLLYKQALNMLAGGIGTVIGSSIFIQFITVAYAYKASSLGAIIVLIYILIIIEAIGFMLIASGAKRLKRIEEI